jgi:hypothetical protein
MMRKVLAARRFNRGDHYLLDHRECAVDINETLKHLSYYSLDRSKEIAARLYNRDYKQAKFILLKHTGRLLFPDGMQIDFYLLPSSSDTLQKVS